MKDFYIVRALKTAFLTSMGKSLKAIAGIQALLILLIFLSAAESYAQAPSLSYAGPQNYIQGTAISPLTPTSSGVATAGYSSPVQIAKAASCYGIGVDAAGNVYIAAGGAAVEKIPAGGGTPVILGYGFGFLKVLTADAAGNVYFGNGQTGALQEIRASDGALITICPPPGGVPSGIAVDSQGNVYAVFVNNGNIYKIVAGSGVATSIYNQGGGHTVAVDGSGNVYFDAGGFLRMLTAGSYNMVNIQSLGTAINSITADASGHLYIVYYQAEVVELDYNGGIGKNLFIGTSTSLPWGVAVDALGNVYYTEYKGNFVGKIAPNGGYFLTKGLPAGLIFDSHTGVISGTPIVQAAASNYNIIAYNGASTTQAAVNITVAPAPNNANLTSLTLSSGTLSPVFDVATTSYTAGVANSVSSITVTPVTSDASATVTVNGTTVAYGAASGPISLSVGSNTITTVVTSHDGTVTKTYVVTVTRALSANANLSDLHLNISTLSPAFVSTSTSYTVGVGSAVPSIKITPTVADGTATVKVNGTTVVSGTSSAAIPLAIGPNAIPVVVTAQDGSQKTYTVTVNKGSANANLSNLVLSGVTLNPAFLTSKLHYTGVVPYATTSLTVTPTTTDAGATVKVNGTTVVSGSATGAISLAVGANTINTVVTSQNGLVTVTYTVTVNRAAPAKNAALTYMQLNNATLSPAFHYTTYSYTASVSNATTSTRVTVTVSDSNATVKVNGTTVTPRIASPPIALAVGANTINTVVTAQDGTTTQTYTITATRASGPVIIPDESISVVQSPATPTIENDGVMVHAGISPNGDGINDFLTIDGIGSYPDNKLTIINRNGALVFEAKDYDNSNKVFDGHDSRTGKMQLPGTYYYSLEYNVNGVTKHRTGYIVMKY